MTKVACDICGRELDDFTMYQVTVTPPPRCSSGFASAELCQECDKKLREWLWGRQGQQTTLP